MRVHSYATARASGPILHHLDRIGVGVTFGRVALLAANLIKPLPRGRAKALDADSASALAVGMPKPGVRGKHARIAVEEIWQSVSAGCEITWDYIGLIMVASAIAGLGLATNNTVMIVASMLLSPLMNPILGFTLGAVMRDNYLVRVGIRAELGGLIATIFVGLCVGILFSPWSDQFSWPTNEMSSRGEPTSLLIGLAFAVPSGVGVALSATGSGGTNSLVGVAIAARCALARRVQRMWRAAKSVAHCLLATACCRRLSTPACVCRLHSLDQALTASSRRWNS